MKPVYPKILLPIKKELELVNKNIEKGMHLKVGHVSQFTNLDLHWYDRYLHPGLLVLSARMFNNNSPQIITMASAMQFLYLGTGIHFGKYDQRLGLPVLIGDYFYSRFFSYMSEGEALEWLAETAQVVCEIHVAGIREKEEAHLIQSDINKYIQILKSQSSLLGFCASFGPSSVKTDEKYVKTLFSFGRNLGAAIHLIRNKEDFKLTNKLLIRAKESLDLLPETEEKIILLKITNHFMSFCKKKHLVS